MLKIECYQMKISQFEFDTLNLCFLGRSGGLKTDESISRHLRVGAFNVQRLGKKKIADPFVSSVLIQVMPYDPFDTV